MAATNYTPIQLYYSTTASAAPTAGNLTSGELAINITDGKLYYKDNGGVVQVIATKGAGTIGGSTTQIQYNNAGALAGNAAMTFNSATSTTTLTTLNLTNALGATYGGTAQSAYTQGDVLYASAANTLSKLGIGTVNYILTSTGSVPQWSAPSSITVQTATNLAGGAGGSVPYQSAADTTTFLAIGAANRVMTSSGSAPQWVTALTGLTGVSSSSITNTSLTSGRVVLSSTGGLQADDADLTFDGVTLSAGGYSTTGLSTLVKTVTIGNSNFSGTAVFAAATPAKLYIGTGTVTDTTSAIGATNATGAISSLAITPIAATNTSVTYTNAATLYIAGAPSAGTNVTLTNPYALYIAAGNVYLGGGTANGVAYLNSSKVLTSGTALVFDGTNLGIGSTSPATYGKLDINQAVDPGTTPAALSVRLAGVGGGTAVPQYGINVDASQSYNNASILYGIKVVANQNVGGVTYGVHSTTTPGNSTVNRWAIYGKANVNADASHSLSTLPVGVYGEAGNTTGTTNISTSAAGYFLNSSTLGSTAYGVYIKTSAGPTTPVPLRVDHDASELLRVTSAGQLLVNTAAALYTNSKIQATASSGPTLGIQQTTANQYAGGFWNTQNTGNLIAFFTGLGGSQIGDITGTTTTLNINGPTTGSGIQLDNTGGVAVRGSDNVDFIWLKLKSGISAGNVKTISWEDTAGTVLAKDSITFGGGIITRNFGSFYNSGATTNNVLSLNNTGATVTGTLSVSGDSALKGVNVTFGNAVGNSNYGIKQFYNAWNASGYNWQVDVGYLGGTTGFCFTPSTAVGGSTFTTPVLNIYTGGISVTGVISSSGALNVNGLITSTLGNNAKLFTSASATTGYQYMEIKNTSGILLFGLEGSSGGSLLTNGTAYATVLTSVNSQPVEIGVNQLKVAGFTTTGLGVTGAISATGTIGFGATASKTALNTQGTTTVTAGSATTIYNTALGGNMGMYVMVIGVDASGNWFCDFLTFLNNNTTTLLAGMNGGAPGSRTYSVAAGVLRLNPSVTQTQVRVSANEIQV